jgi:hypothetical protein
LCWQPKQTRTLEGGDELGPAQGEILYMNLALQRKKECTVYEIGLVQRENRNKLALDTERLYMNLALQVLKGTLISTERQHT